MFKTVTKSGTRNLCGRNVYKLRKEAIPKMSQRILAEKMQLLGGDVDKNAIQRIESGQRFVTDIELSALKTIFRTTYEDLLDEN